MQRKTAIEHQKVYNPGKLTIKRWQEEQNQRMRERAELLAKVEVLEGASAQVRHPCKAMRLIVSPKWWSKMNCVSKLHSCSLSPNSWLMQPSLTSYHDTCLSQGASSAAAQAAEQASTIMRLEHEAAKKDEEVTKANNELDTYKKRVSSLLINSKKKVRHTAVLHFGHFACPAMGRCRHWSVIDSAHGTMFVLPASMALYL